jgi:hypothetical protein
MNTANAQLAMFYDSRQTGEADEIFMGFLRDGLTRHELAKNIENRSSHWGRYTGYFRSMPSSPLEGENDQHREIVDLMLEKITENGLEVMEQHPTDVVVFDRQRLVQVAYPGAQLLWMVSNSASHLFLLGVHPDENRVAIGSLSRGMDFICHIQVGRTVKLTPLTPDKAEALCDRSAPGYSMEYIHEDLTEISHHGKKIATLKISTGKGFPVAIYPQDAITKAERGATQLWAEKYQVEYSGTLFSKGTITWETKI